MPTLEEILKPKINKSLGVPAQFPQIVQPQAQVPAIAPMSPFEQTGKTLEDISQKARQLGEAVESQPGRAPASMQDPLIQTFLNQQQSALDERKKGLQFLQGMITTEAEKYAKSADNADLTPVIAILDHIGGTNFSSMYRPAKNAEESKKQILQLKNAYNELNNKIYDDTNSYINQLQEMSKNSVGEDKKEFQNKIKEIELGLKAAESERRAEVQQLGFDIKRSDKIERIQNSFNKKIDPIRDSIAVMAPIVESMKSGNPIGVSNVGLILARLFGEKGVLSDQDIARWKGDASIMNRAKDYYSKATGGIPGDVTQQELAELLQFGLQAQKQKLESIFNTAVGQGYKQGIFKDRSEVSDILLGGQEEVLSLMGSIPDTKTLIQKFDFVPEQSFMSKAKGILFGGASKPDLKTKLQQSVAPQAPAPTSSYLLQIKRGQ